MKRFYEIAGHRLAFAETLKEGIDQLPGFRPFLVEKDGAADFEFVTGETAPSFAKVQYTLEYEDVKGSFGTTEQGYLLVLSLTARRIGGGVEGRHLDAGFHRLLQLGLEESCLHLPRFPLALLRYELR